jgi:hypothetical protein
MRHVPHSRQPSNAAWTWPSGSSVYTSVYTLAGQTCRQGATGTRAKSMVDGDVGFSVNLEAFRPSLASCSHPPRFSAFQQILEHLRSQRRWRAVRRVVDDSFPLGSSPIHSCSGVGRSPTGRVVNADY